MLDSLETSTALTPVFKLSREQLAVASFVMDGRGNILVVARAGTGKTFLIRQCIPLMSGTVAVVAFARKISNEISLKIAQDGNNADVGTFHSFGARAIRKAFKDSMIEGKKGELRTAGYKKFDRIAKMLEIPAHLVSFVQKAASLAMQRGFGVFHALNDPQEWLALVQQFDLDDDIAEDNVACQIKGRAAVIREGLQFACKAVKLSIQLAHEVYSYDDMLYLPLILNLKLPTFSWVCVDEAQDSNPARREMARRMVAPGGRMFWVGDDRQAIFGFTGADNDALEQIGTQFRCTRFPMTVTFRCAKAIVELAQGFVPDYRAAPTNPLGSTSVIEEKAFDCLSLVPGDDAVICRKTAPLVTLAYRLITRGIPAHVEGKDIGKGLIAMIERFSVKSLTILVDRLNAYREKETTKLLGEKKEMQADALSDKVDTVLVLIMSLPRNATVADLRDKIESLFADTKDGVPAKTVALMTAHRSKGLEFPRVFGYGVAKWMPAKGAKQPWQLSQEENLEYVLITRAMLTYIEVVVEEEAR